MLVNEIKSDVQIKLRRDNTIVCMGAIKYLVSVSTEMQVRILHSCATKKWYWCIPSGNHYGTHPAPVRPFCGTSWHAGAYVCMSNYVFDKWSHGFHLLGREDVHCSRGNEIEWSKMKHSSAEVDRWLYRAGADVAREGQGDDVLFNDIWEQHVNTNGCFHFSSSLCPRVLFWVSTVWCLGWNKKTDESWYDVCPVLPLPLHHRASTAWVMMMTGAARTGAYYFTMLKR